MKNRLTAAITAVIITIFTALPVFAEVSRDWQNGDIPSERQLPRAVDYTDTISDDRLESLNLKLDELSKKWNMDFTCVLDTEPDNYDTAAEYADAYYDYNGFAEDGILLAVFSESRDWAISTKGSAIDLFEGNEDGIIDHIRDNLSDGDYYNAFIGYVYSCDRLLTYYNSSDGNDNNNDDYIADAPDNNKGYGSDDNIGYTEPANPKVSTKNIIIAVGISVVIGIASGFIGTGIMKSKLKSVRFQSGAADYMVDNSFKMHDSRDIYLYSTVTKTERPTDNNTHSGGSHGGGFGGGTHISSSGSIHGGSSGKF